MFENPFGKKPLVPVVNKHQGEAEKIGSDIVKHEENPQERILRGVAMWHDYMDRHPELSKVTVNPEDAEPYIDSIVKMFDLFEEVFSLDELNAITTEAEAMASPLRKGAKAALIPIVNSFKILKIDTNITSDKYEELKARYKIYSKAVGMINGTTLRHD